MLWAKFKIWEGGGEGRSIDGIQNSIYAFARSIMPEAYKKMKSLSSMKSLIVAAVTDATQKGRFQESTEKPIAQMKNVFSRLERKGRKVIFMT